MSELRDLDEQIISCQKCPLARTRTRAVPGEGPEDAQIMFIGEGPGWHEDQQGRPFVGPAGQLLEQLLAQVGLKRSEVYIANVVKCRPPNNRDPLPSEIEACAPYLNRQLELIKPKVVVSLGSYSTARFFPKEPIGKIRGSPFKRDGVIYYPMYHPAAALHQQSLRRTIEEDMKKIPALLRESQAIREETPKPQQLAMF